MGRLLLSNRNGGENFPAIPCYDKLATEYNEDYDGEIKMKKTLTAVSLLAVLAATGCTPSGDNGTPLSDKIGASSSPTFSDLKGMPEGWVSSLTAEIPEDEKAEAEAHFKNRPPAQRNADNTCTYDQEQVSLPSYMENRGEDFLSKFFVYQQAESNGNIPKDGATSVPVETSAGKLEFVYTKYDPKIVDLKSNTDKNASATDVKPVQVYRAVAVRVFDTAIKSRIQPDTQASAPFGSDAAKSLPGVMLTYECKTKDAFSEEEAKSLFAATRVDIKK